MTSKLISGGWVGVSQVKGARTRNTATPGHPLLIFITCVTEKSKIWLHVGSVSFTLTFAFHCFWYYNLPQGTLPLCLNTKLKGLCSAHRDTIWPCLPVNGCRKEEINTSPLQCWPSQEIFCKTNGLFTLLSHLLPPSLFYKRNWHPDPSKMVFGDISLPSSPPAGFPNKVAIPCLNTLSPDLLACRAASRVCLDSVTHGGLSETQKPENLSTLVWHDVLESHSFLNGLSRHIWQKV